MENDFRIRTASVNIKVMTVDEKRMTKSVFNQIEAGNPFNKDLEFCGDGLLGYVKDRGKYLLWIKDGKLRRYNLQNLQLIVTLERNTNLTRDIENALWALHIRYTSSAPYYNLKNELEKALGDKRNFEKFKLIQTSAKEFLNHIADCQLFISV